MEFFKANTKIRFMKQRWIAAVFSLIIFAASIGALIANGLTLGLDFTGGTQVTATFAQPIDPSQLRLNLHKQ
ncbi:MAG: protein translocase subunit SecF, partial [Coxiellaceae bacterium]|nr:protein translocase subunit SecF [Coxiellaceae bacterium]